MIILFGGLDIHKYGFSLKNKFRNIIAGIIIYFLIFSSTLGPLYIVLIIFGSKIFFNVKIFLVVLPSMLVVGLGEEALFRGLLQRLFIEKIGYRKGFFLSSFVLFVIWHMVWFYMYQRPIIITTIYIILAGLLGILLGLAFEGSDSLLAVIITHGLWDAVMASLYVSNPALQIHRTY